MVPLADEDLLGLSTLANGLAFRVHTAVDFKQVMSSCCGRTLRTGKSMLNNFGHWYRGGGCGLNDGAKLVSAAFDYELSIRPVLKHGPRSLTCARVIGNY